MIDPEILKQVRRIQVRTRRLVTDLLAGGYTSVFKGSGIEFDEVREFSEGDDIRSVDWNVTARTGRPYVKKFVEERELSLLFLVDTGPSLLYGSQARSPRRGAAELCACLAFAALRSNDKVGLLFCGEGPGAYIPPGKGPTHVMRVVREVLAEPAGKRGGGIPGGVEFLGRVLRRKSVLFLVSDFHFPLEPLEGPLRRISRRHDVIGAQLLDPRDLDLPRVGLLEMADAETGKRIMLDTGSGEVRARWREEGERHLARVGNLFKRSGADRMIVRLDESPAIPLLRLFRERERRRVG